MASAYDEIKKVLGMIRQGEPITEESRAELKRVRRLLEEQVAAAELITSDLPTSRMEARVTVPTDSLAIRQAGEP
jgi:hypothetical protein